MADVGVLGLYWDNGKGNGNYDLGFRVKAPVAQRLCSS